MTLEEEIEEYGEEIIATFHARTEKGEDDVVFKSLSTWEGHDSFEDFCKYIADYQGRKVTFRRTARTQRA